MRLSGWMLFVVAAVYFSKSGPLLSSMQAVLIVLWGAGMLGIISFGWRGFVNGIMTLRVIFSNNPVSLVNREAFTFFRGMQTYFLAMGVLGSIFGLVEMLANMSDPRMLGPSLATALIPVFYGLFLSYFLCYPALTRLAEVSATLTEIPDRLPHKNWPGFLYLSLPLLIIGCMPLVSLISTRQSGEDVSVKGGVQNTEVQRVMVGEMYRLEPFVVNITLGEQQTLRHLKIEISLEMSRPDVKAELVTRGDQIRDLILSFLSTVTIQDLSTLEGKFNLREALLLRLNSILISGTIVRIYFREFVLQ